MDELRVTAAYFVKESDLTKAAKLQIMNFLENQASDAQVMALLLDGEIQPLDEMAEEIVYDRFDAALLDEGVGSVIKSAAKTVGRKARSLGQDAYGTGYRAGDAAIYAGKVVGLTTANLAKIAAKKAARKGAKTLKRASRKLKKISK